MSDDFKLPPRKSQPQKRGLLGGSAPATELAPLLPPGVEQLQDETPNIQVPGLRQPSFAQPMAKRPRKKLPVTRKKLSLVIDKATHRRFMNTFAYLNQTGQVDRYSHMATQAFNEFCERIEQEQNGGEPFEAPEVHVAPTGAPPKRED